MRIDKLLWFIRLSKSRMRAQELVVQGHLRMNRKRIERPAQPVSVGDILTVPLGSSVLSVQILALPDRRGPAAEAQSCYRVLDGRADNPIAGGEQPAAKGISLP